MSRGPPQGTGAATPKRIGRGTPQEIPSVWPPQGYRTAASCSEDPSTPDLQFNGNPGGTFSTLGEEGLAVLNNVLLLSDGDREVHAVDVEDPTAPTILDTISDFGNLEDTNAIEMETDEAYCGGSDLFTSLDTSDPENLSVDDSIQTFSRFIKRFELDTDRSIAVIPEELNGIHIIDISDPTNMSILGSNDPGGIGRDLAVTIDGNFAYMTDFNNDRIISFDISDTAAPTVSDTLADATDLNGVLDATTDASSNLFTPASDGGRLTVVDISDPANLSVTSSLDGFNNPRAVGLSSDEQTAWVVQGTGDAIESVDVSDVNNLSVLGSLSATLDNPDSYAVDSRDFKYSLNENLEQLIIWC